MPLHKNEDAMKVKLVVTLLAATSMVAPAYAASFYVVQNSKTHKCMVASKQPSEKSKTVALVGDVDVEDRVVVVES